MALDLKRYENVLRKQTGKAIRPARYDGYVNLINRYGTSKDDTEQYFFRPEPIVDDMTLEMFYENNGLFARIIDTPAEEAVKHGFKLEGVADDDVTKFYQSALDELDWEEVAMTAIKWARLFGGSIAIMLINDGRALEEPVDWKHIQSIDDIVVFDRSTIVPDRTSLYEYDPQDPFRTRGSRLGTPEWYQIMGPNGNFVVHDSRCLTFRNGVLPLNALNENYQIWGIPEYVRINRAVRNAEVAHESAPKMLSKSVQPVYKMKDLAMELASEEGEDKVLRRLQAIDMARGLLNSITIDAEGEDYSFQSFGFNGVSDVIESSCNWLSALTNIPQTILFGRSPAGMNATGHSDFETYYNYVERIQKRMLRSNLRYLLSIIFTAGKHTREISQIPEINVEFNPLWSLDETEETQLESQKLQNELTRANIAQTYIGMEVLDPKEVRVELGKEEELDPETMLDDMSEEELLESAPQGQQGMGGMPGAGGGMDMGGMMMGGAPQAPDAAQAMQAQGKPNDYALKGNSPETAPEATKLPQDMREEEPDHEDAENLDDDWVTIKGTHVLIDEEGNAQSGGKLKGQNFGNAKSINSENKSKAKPKQESAFTPKRTDYVTEFQPKYGSKITLEETPPELLFDYWKEMNRDKLIELYKKERKEAEEKGEPKPSGREIEKREFYSFQTQKVSNDIEYIDDEYKCDDILSESIPSNVFHGWFTEYNSEYKPRVVNGLIASPKARSAALSLMYKNYQYNGGDLGFKEFLTTPVKMYRGGHGQKHIDEDVFSSYTFSKKVAEGFAGNDGKVYEAEIRPIDTWGSVNTIGESEIMVPSWIAPNGNMDSEDENSNSIFEKFSPLRHGFIRDQYRNATESGRIESFMEGPVKDLQNWLIEDTDAAMSFTSEVESEAWLDDEIKRRIRAVGVIVVDKHGKILTGVRKGGDGDNYGLLGGPGGHVEPSESLEDAAIRETYEEFGIQVKDLTFITLGDYEEDSGMIPAIFLCTDWDGGIYPSDGEMENIRFRTIDDIMTHNLFGPFKSSLEILQKVLTNVEESDIMESNGEEDDIHMDGNPAFVRAVFGKARSLGFPKDNNDLDEAFDWLETHGVSDTKKIFNDYQKNRKHQKEANEKKGKEQEKREKANSKKHENDLTEEGKQNLKEARVRASKVFKEWKLKKPREYHDALTQKMFATKADVKKATFGKLKVKPFMGSEFVSLDDHYQKHVIERKEKTFQGMSKKQYLEFAKKLAESEPGKTIKGMMRNNGDIYRYDTEKNVLVVVGGMSGAIITCHELTETKYSELIKGGISGRAYFEFMKMAYRWR